MLSRIQQNTQIYAPEPAASRATAASDGTFSAALKQETGAQGSQNVSGLEGMWQIFADERAGITPPPAPRAPAPAGPAAPPFVPQFLTNVRVLDSDHGTSEPLNPAYFATRDTAQYIADKFGTGQLIEQPYAGPAGPFAATASEYYIQLPNGRTVNAGLLADYYTRMPEAQFPGLADLMIRDAINQLS